MLFYVYILYSPSHNRTYVGQTNNISTRLDYHNKGKVKSTKAFRPWILIYFGSFSSRADAMKKELWFKSHSGRKKISEFLNSYLLNHFS
ncbi:GIY-YIG nuclease family protein [Rosettibacter firmus]|uniref:GIY-YIG nuclease family protein n=1 Tax=Rosettibacter firmus TaxID=3111522 RepID=UPI00336BBA66